MQGELTFAPTASAWLRHAARWHARAQLLVAAIALAGVAALCALVLSKTFFLGSDSAHHYAHVWYISDQVVHHGRLPLHVVNLESGDALTFPYAVAPWLIAVVPFAIFGDWAVTATMVAGFVLYGYCATRARPALRDARLLALLYANTFLIEALVSFQFAFVWACVFFFLFVEATDRRRWLQSGAWATLAVTTHPFAGAAAVGAYALFAVARRPRDVLPLATALAVATAVVLPFAFYWRTAPSLGETSGDDLAGTLRFIARFRGSILLLPFVLSAAAPAARVAFLPLFAAFALVFANRIDDKKVNTFGLDRQSHPFYGEFIDSPAFDRSLRYRVLEPNDREDGAYQLIRNGAVLTQEFFDQSQFRRWWQTPEMYSCFLGAKGVDVVLVEKDYKLKFSENESYRVYEFEQHGRATAIYHDPQGRFIAYDVRRARQDGARFEDCGL